LFPHLTHILLRFVTGSWLIFAVAWAQSPHVATTFPQDGSKGITCYTPIRVTFTFPSEAETLDPVTLNSRNVKLYPVEQPTAEVRLDLTYQAGKRLLLVTPRSVMQGRTQYVLEITRGLIDSRGFACLPFQLRFETGVCDAPPPKPLAEPLLAPKPAITQTRLGHWSLHRKAKKAELNWTTDAEYESIAFRVERSVADSSFRPVGLLPAMGNSSSPQSYHYTDTALTWGDHAYRLVLMSGQGDSVLGDTLHLFREGIILNRDQLYLGQPLPLEFYARERSTYVLLIRNRAGEDVKRKAGFVPAGRSRQLIDLSDLKLGDYALLIQMPKEKLVQVIRVLPDRD